MSAINSIIGIIIASVGISRGTTTVYSNSFTNNNGFVVMRDSLGVQSLNTMYVNPSSMGYVTDSFYNPSNPTYEHGVTFSYNHGSQSTSMWHWDITTTINREQSVFTCDWKENYVIYTDDWDDIVIAYDVPESLYVTMSATCLVKFEQDSTYNVAYSYNRTLDFSHLPSSFSSELHHVILSTNMAAPGTAEVIFTTSIVFSTQLPDVSQIYQNGFANGETYGYQSGLGENGWRLDNFLYSIVDLPVLYLRSLFGFDLYGGISLFSIIVSLITISMVIFIVRKFIG